MKNSFIKEADIKKNIYEQATDDNILYSKDQWSRI